MWNNLNLWWYLRVPTPPLPHEITSSTKTNLKSVSFLTGTEYRRIDGKCLHEWAKFRKIHETKISTLEWKWFHSNSLTECYSLLWESNTLLFLYQVEELLLYQKPLVEHIYEKYFFYFIHLHDVFNFIKTIRWTINVRVLNLNDSLTQAFR